MKLLSRVRLLATPRTAAYQAPLSMGFSRQEYRSGVPLPSLWIYLWPFYFVPLIYISVFVPVPYCLDECSFVVEPEVKQVDSSSSILLSQDFFGYSGSCALEGVAVSEAATAVLRWPRGATD